MCESQFPPSEKGLLKAVNTMTKYHPTMFNRWFAPFSSGLHLYHPDTVLSFFHSGGMLAYEKHKFYFRVNRVKLSSNNE